MMTQIRKIAMFLVGLLLIAPSALVLIAVVHTVKFFHNFGKEKSKEKVIIQSSALARLSDPFHNSRQHPLNSPDAPRG